MARVGALGDTLMAAPVVAALKTVHPQAQIDFLCSSSAAPLLELIEGVSTVYCLQRRNLPFFSSPEKWALARRIRAGRHQFAVLLEGAPRYRFLLKMAGLGEIRSFRERPFDPDLHAAANNLRAAGLDWRSHPLDPRLKPAAADLRDAAGLLEELPLPVVGLHPGYGPAGKKADQSLRLKGWGSANFSNLAQMLLESGASVVATGSRQDRAEAEAALAGLPAERVRNLAGCTGVRQLAALLSLLALHISVDSGPAHLAAAVGTPLVVLWGPAKLQQVRPLSSASPVQIVRRAVPCAPCYDTPAMKSCRKNVCMQLISPSQVFEAALPLIRETGRIPRRG